MGGVFDRDGLNLLPALPVLVAPAGHFFCIRGLIVLTSADANFQTEAEYMKQYIEKITELLQQASLEDLDLFLIFIDTYLRRKR